jgi:hypothetical protein
MRILSRVVCIAFFQTWWTLPVVGTGTGTGIGIAVLEGEQEAETQSTPSLVGPSAQCEGDCGHENPTSLLAKVGELTLLS